MTLNIKPSSYQKDILLAIRDTTKNLGVKAVPGSGKTTTLQLICHLNKQLGVTEQLFAAFNKHIATELQKKLPPDVKCKTFSSLGLRLVKEHLWDEYQRVLQDVQAYKYHDLVNNIVTANYTILADSAKARNMASMTKRRIKSEAKQALLALCNYTRVTLTEPEEESALDALIQHWGLSSIFIEEVKPMVLPVLQAGIIQAQEDGIIDFTDMIWLPAIWDVHCKPAAVPQALMIDEAQDLNLANIDVLLRYAGELPERLRWEDFTRTRVFAVYDTSQAIYGFSGSDASSAGKLLARLDGVEMPLSICYRCAKSIVVEAQAIHPEIQADPAAPEGVVKTIFYNDVLEMAVPGDMIVCRLTAPLISLCLEFLGAGKKATVMGRSITQALTNLADKISALDNYKFGEFKAWTNYYIQAELKKLSEKAHSEGDQEALRDKQRGLLACYDRFMSSANPPKNVSELNKTIAELATEDENTPLIKLSTIHRVKGLEEDRVFLLFPDSCPLVWKGQLPWQYQQELNLRFVAITRAKKELYYVESPSTASALDKKERKMDILSMIKE